MPAGPIRVLKINGIKLNLTAYQMGIRSVVTDVKILMFGGRSLPDDRLDRMGQGGLGTVRQVPEHKDNAQECRELAKRMPRPEDRDALERIARIWERLENVRGSR